MFLILFKSLKICIIIIIEKKREEEVVVVVLLIDDDDDCGFEIFFVILLEHATAIPSFVAILHYYARPTPFRVQNPALNFI